MFADFLVRAAVLLVFVYLVRASLLRSREHEADVRATSWLPDTERVAQLIDPSGHAPNTSAVKGQGLRRWFARHPSAQQRADAVRNPANLGSLRLGELMAAAWATGSTLWFAVDIAQSAGSNLATSDRLARAATFAVLGAYVSLTFVRAAATDHLEGAVLLTACGVAALSVAVGAMVSVERTGLFGVARVDGVDVALTCLFTCVPLVVFLGDAARALRPVGAVGATVLTALGVAFAALGAAAVFPLALAVANNELEIAAELARTLPDAAMKLLSLVVVLTAVAALVRHPSARAAFVPMAAGVGAGLCSFGAAFVLGLSSASLQNDDALWRFILRSVWVCVALSVTAAWVTACFTPYPLMGAVLGGAVSAMIGAAGVVGTLMVLDSVGRPLGAYVDMAHMIGGFATFVGLPLAAVVAGVALATRTSTAHFR